MSTYGRLAAEATDQYLAALDTAQQNFLKLFATMPAPSLSYQPSTMPGLPTAQEIIEASFSFTEKLLVQQQSFMQKLVASPEPRTEVPAAPAVAMGKAVSPKSKNAN
ncbi:MAG TPA: hypothetical protein VM692_15695 [Gammaproteobacteria bacterium]|nr:hypothetical protein [Gammaproteobacteria bacterium]